MAINKFNIGEFTIVDTALSSAGTTFTVAASKRNRKGQDDGSDPQYYEFPKLTYTSFRFTITEKGGERVEVVGCASVADASNDLSDGRKRYTITVGKYDDNVTLWRGIIQNEDGTNAIANKDADLIVDNFPVGSICKIAWDVAELTALNNSFSSNTTQVNDAVSGEAFSVRDQLSLHTDGKYYKYHNINYPNWRATAGFTATAADEVGTVYLPGYLVPGYSGLTVGVTTYADNGGTTVQVETATSYPIGYAESTAENRLQALVETTVTELSQVQITDETSTVFGTVSGQRVDQAIKANQGEIGDVKMVETTGTGVLGVAGNQSFGWAVCNGTTPASQGITSPVRTEITPNMVAKFIRGNATTSGATGGLDTVTLSEAQLPSHTHGLNYKAGAQATVDIANANGFANTTGPTVTNMGHGSPDAVNTAIIASVGSDNSHENKPPYYEVVYMIKVR